MIPFKRAGQALMAVAVAAAALGAAAIPQTAHASRPGKLLVDSDGPARFWAGVLRSAGPGIPNIPQCQHVSCDKRTLKIKLPRDTWRRPGGIQVAIRWDGATEGSLGLFVYRDNRLVAKSTALVGAAQSVIIPAAGNGAYEVYVSYGVTFGAVDPDPVIPYEGLAEVEYQPPVQPIRDLLPDLASLPQENVTYDNPGMIFNDVAQPGQSCFDSERAEQQARQCMRFDQVLQNVGAGPLELRFTRQSGVFQDEDAVQRAYRSDHIFYDLPAGRVEFHAIHGHYHFKGFAQSELWPLDGAGNLGTAPAAVGDKVSFCVADTDLVGWGQKGDAALSYPAPDCLEPKQVEGATEHFSYGMSRGWADRYNWYLPDQMIDTSGLSDGAYALFTTVDPDDRLRESNDGNNCGAVIVALTGLATDSPHAELLGPGPPCPSG